MPLAPATITRFVIDWDEDACQMLFEYDGDGYMHSAVLADPEQLYDAVKGAIGPWLRERDDARNAVARGVSLKEYLQDENAPDGWIGTHEGGYATSDPKHPEFHSVHTDIWDARDGK
jgi:hypothetical protein